MATKDTKNTKCSFDCGVTRPSSLKFLTKSAPEERHTSSTAREGCESANKTGRPGGPTHAVRPNRMPMFDFVRNSKYFFVSFVFFVAIYLACVSIGMRISS